MSILKMLRHPSFDLCYVYSTPCSNPTIQPPTNQPTTTNHQNHQKPIERHPLIPTRLAHAAPVCRHSSPLVLQGNAANSSETSMATQPGGSVTSRAASECRSAAPGSSGVGGHGGGGGASGSGRGGSGAAGCSGAGSSGAAPAKFRHGLLQLMIHTIDPLHDGKWTLRTSMRMESVLMLSFVACL